MHDKKTKLDTLNLSGIARGIISSIDDIRDHNFIAKGLGSVPIPLQSRLAKQYVDRYNKNSKKAEYDANRWFDLTMQKLKPRFSVLFRITQNMPLPWHILSNKDKTKHYATTTAKECVSLLLDVSDGLADEDYEVILKESYEKVGEYTQKIGVFLPFWDVRQDVTLEALEVALLKAQCENWWATKLKSVRKRYLELLEIATGQVGKDVFRTKNNKSIKRKGISPYSSKQAQAEFREQQKSGRDFLSKLELENDQGEVIDLLKAVDKGMANPVNRRNELMLRMRETEELADEMGYVGVFYTLTCPSKYHPKSHKWNGSTPKDSQAYLVKTWSQTRSKLNRLGINYFGIRVAEPHADACPHWHMMLFMPKNKVQWVNAIIRKYFISEDRQELINRYEDRATLFKAYKQKRRLWGHKKSQGIKTKAPNKFYRTFSPRFTAVLMDKTKGSAAGYIAKYISKNIDGYQVTDHEDDETGENIVVNPVLAWASTWGIRQFQFQGSPSVTVYRELRRVRKPVEQFDLERVRQAADVGSWLNFSKLMGGMCIGRNANFKTAYEITPMGNKYAEAVKRVKGVVTGTSAIAQAVRELRGEVSVTEDATLLTRVTTWVKQLKGTAERLAAQDAGFVGAADQSWTSGNNCTPMATTTRAELKLGMLGLSKNEIFEIKKGKKVRKKDRIYQLIDKQVVSFDIESLSKQQQKDEIKHFAAVNARKSMRGEPNKVDWQLAKDLVACAFSHAFNDGRAIPNDDDWQYARDVESGDAELDWWDAGLMSA
ncbi:MAG: replication endonuclease [Colwellia sp.]|nr:replication endonuclease [Colwellia sp.]